MSRSHRFGSAISAAALAALLAGCASPTSRGATLAGGKVQSTAGLATRAVAALSAGDFTSAVAFAERAVEAKPDDALIRSVLGHAYFASGRFASAEAAYRDSLSLRSNDPQLVLKLALVQIAQGKNREALSFLEATRDLLDPADLGLAIALAGQPAEAVFVLEQAARAPGADARVRQNLALAHGLAGDWIAARTIAAQDLTPDLVASRVQHWLTLAKPVRPSDQVAALVGVTPAAVDPGQPTRLALNHSPGASATRHAEVVPQQAPAPQPLPQFVEATPAPQPLPQFAEAAPVPQAVTFAPEPHDPAPVTAQYSAPTLAAAFQAPAAEELVSVATATASSAEAAPPPPPLLTAIAPTMKVSHPRKAAAVRNGNAGVVVQLGAYSSPDRVEAAWEQVARKYAPLRQYVPTSARFDSAAGPVYRLSVKGFATTQEASGLCSSLRRQGGNCFVRRLAGDLPVRFASR